MSPDLYQRVSLGRDFDEYGLKQGDIVTIVDRVPHPAGGEDGVVLEAFSASGETIAVLVAKASDVRAMRDDQVLTIRSMEDVGSPRARTESGAAGGYPERSPGATSPGRSRRAKAANKDPMGRPARGRGFKELLERINSLRIKRKLK